ncbi:MAG: hypothetical protein GY753_06965 [Gammaproteobacteria bacterium]|nr:hypothetical protein [Gammaproteobacteria bacterium]
MSKTYTLNLTELESDKLWAAIHDSLERLVVLASDAGVDLTADEKQERDALRRILKKLHNATPPTRTQ